MPDAAGKVNIVLSVNQANFSAGMAEAQRELDKFAGKTKAAGHGTVSSMQAASASIRLLENPLGSNIRAIERLISQSKVLSNVMKAAFPLVGAIAIGGMIAKLGAEVAAFIKKIQEMPKAIQQGFDALNLSARTTNDELDLTNARLANQIAKLQGKPQNNLKTALYESRVEADKLATSLARDAKSVNDLLTQNKIGMLGQLLGKANTNSVDSSVMVYMNDLQALGNRLSEVTGQPGKEGEATSLRKQIKDKQNAGLGWAKSKLFITDNTQFAGPEDGIMGGDQAGNRTKLLGFQGVLLGQQHNAQSEDTNKELKGQEETEQAKKTAAELAKRNAAKALEAQKAADNKRLKQMEESLHSQTLNGNVSVRATYEFWTNSISAFRKGSDAYDAVVARQAEAAKAGAAQAHAWIEKQKAQDKREDSTDELSGNAIVARSNQFFQRENVKSYGESTQDQVDSNQLATLTATNEARAREVTLTEQAGRTMSRYAASVELAAIHAEEYATQIGALKAMLDIRSQQASVDPTKENKKALAEAQDRVTEAEAKRNVQIQQDNENISPTASKGSVGFTDALNDFVIASRDAAAQMRELTDNTLNTLNAEIVKGMSGQKTNFKGAGASIFRDVASTGLKKAEGSALSALGFGGKADGSKSNPLYVRMADEAGKAAESIGSGIINMFKGGKDGSDSTDSGGSSFFGGLMSGLAGFAGGGAVSPGTLAMVGERGPELAYFGSGANVIPNHKLSAFGGSSGDTHHWNIDARSATDPAQTAAQTQRAIMMAAPYIVAASQKAQAQKQRRSPSSRP